MPSSILNSTPKHTRTTFKAIKLKIVFFIVGIFPFILRKSPELNPLCTKSNKRNFLEVRLLYLDDGGLNQREAVLATRFFLFFYRTTIAWKYSFFRSLLNLTLDIFYFHFSLHQH